MNRNKKMEREGKLKTQVIVSEEEMNIINNYQIGSSQVRIKRYYPPIIHSRCKYLIGL